MSTPFYLRKDNIYAVPIIHYNMETAINLKLAIEEIQPHCIAVELAETMTLQLLHAASRLPDISIIITYDQQNRPLYYISEPCDAAFEGLRSALEKKIPAYCIDLDVDDYPDVHENLPDPYSVTRIGVKAYYALYQDFVLSKNPSITEKDHQRELYMAKRLKELSFSFDKILFISGMAHTERVLTLTVKNAFPLFKPANRSAIELASPSEKSCREILSEYGWISTAYEDFRNNLTAPLPDRQRLIYSLFQTSGKNYEKSTGNGFPGYHLRNIMKFSRNYAHLYGMLLPNLYQILSASKACVDHNYAYEVWLLATEYSFLKNVDALPTLDLTIDDIYGRSKIIRFHMRQYNQKKDRFFNPKRKDRSKIQFKPPGPFSICSYQPDDVAVENFGRFLQKKGTQILTEEAARTVPFSASIEDGIDIKETIRHWYEKKLFVKVSGKPPGGVGSVVMIFDPDCSEEQQNSVEKYPWKTTWIGEHSQESDMAFYATPMLDNIIGPGISRCEYGGFMMSYPPRRMFDVWSDPDYSECTNKSEVLLMAAIDYAIKPLIVYVASKPPRTLMKSYAKRFGKKVVYIPIGQLSPITLNKLRAFHVLDGHHTRGIADDYIF